jgi:DNA-binding MurR/RpiR family transcriptional regulator
MFPDMTQNESSEPSPDATLGRLVGLSATPAERRIVEYLLTLSRAERGVITAEDIVRRTGSSRSTLDRLARRLDFSGFKSLRRALVAPPASGQAEISLDPTIHPDDAPADVARKVLGSLSSRTETFAQVLTADARLRELVGLLDDAGQIVVCGVGMSSMVAMDLHNRLLRLGLHVSYSEDIHTQLAYVALMRPGDVAICISYSGRTETIVQAATTASERGGSAVALTAANDSPLARSCKLTITTPPGVGLFGNDAAITRLLQMAFTDVLFHCLVLLRPERLDGIATIDEALQGFKVSDT